MDGKKIYIQSLNCVYFMFFNAVDEQYKHHCKVYRRKAEMKKAKNEKNHHSSVEKIYFIEVLYNY